MRLKKLFSVVVCLIIAIQVVPLWGGTVFAEGVNQVQTLSLGDYHSAAIKTDGSLWMWGNNIDGQIGNGTTTDQKTPVKIMDNVASVSLGGWHSAAIKTDGSLWMWGYNCYGQIGNGTTTNQYIPVKIMDNVASVSLGFWHSAAIKTDGSLWMWGNNKYGQLGNGTTTDQYTPVKIMDNVASVSLGFGHSAAIKTDGSLWMWGNNKYGQLGNGTTTEQHTPVKIMDNVASVSLGADHSAAIKTDGSLWMWGWNFSGQIGNGTTTDQKTPVKIMDNVASVSIGGIGRYHSAAIKTDGSLWKWGGNSSGKIGNGTTTDQYTPVKIMDNVASVSLGANCSAAIKTDGSLWMWGENSSGQIGNGTTTDQHTPVKIMDNVMLPYNPNAPKPGEDVRVTLPNFRIYINDIKIDNRYLLYPYIVYNEITYFPMTYDGARFLGLGTSWTQESGLEIYKLDGQGADGPDNTGRGMENSEPGFTAKIASGKIKVNGKAVNNATEKYPLLTFRNVTYFPLTWRFAVEEFGWQYEFLDAKGLMINSR